MIDQHERVLQLIDSWLDPMNGSLARLVPRYSSNWTHEDWEFYVSEIQREFMEIDKQTNLFVVRYSKAINLINNEVLQLNVNPYIGEMYQLVLSFDIRLGTKRWATSYILSRDSFMYSYYNNSGNLLTPFRYTLERVLYDIKELMFNSAIGNN